ncbi:MAG: DUF262 domain-containing protein [Pyrinomonadaceae bacterium]
MFNPKTQYEIVPQIIQIREFQDYWEEFVVRPPYQRKSVWSPKKKRQLLDSLFRRYYIPRIVIREVRRDNDRTAREVIDGQQRITTAKEFLSDELTLPKSLADVHPELPGARYSKLPADLRRFVDREFKYEADVIKGIEDPKNPEHQRIASDIFWRLQQGETLTYMEIAHARLSSLSRNFVVKYADDIQFDYERYEPVDSNPDKHPFFRVIDRNNDRMQHLALQTRLLILEENDGLGDLKDTNVMEYIDKYQAADGIGNYSFENKPHAKATLRVMQVFYEIFKNDPMIADGEGGIKELRIEYFIISVYLLLRHLLKYYVFDNAERELFREFAIEFHKRWKAGRESDNDISVFSEHRQQTASEIDVRQRIIRQLFFEYILEKGLEVLTKDERRALNEAERILVYRRDNGLCQICVADGKPEKECIVPWAEYDADHVMPHTKGGKTVTPNAQVTCRYHNQKKGARVEAAK